MCNSITEGQLVCICYVLKKGNNQNEKFINDEIFCNKQWYVTNQETTKMFFGAFLSNIKNILNVKNLLLKNYFYHVLHFGESVPDIKFNFKV